MSISTTSSSYAAVDNLNFPSLLPFYRGEKKFDETGDENIELRDRLLRNPGIQNIVTAKKTLSFDKLAMVECDAECGKFLSDILVVNKSLRELFFSRRTSGKALQALCKGLEHHRTIEELHIANIDKFDLHIDSNALCRALEHNTMLKHLSLCGMNIGNEACIHLCQGLENNTKLQELNLSHNKIGDEGCKALSKLLGPKKKLKRLLLNYNKSGDEGFIAICKALEHDTNLRDLEFMCNNIGNGSALALVNVLEVNKYLRNIFLYSNKIEKDGISALAYVVSEKNMTLKKLGLLNNDFDQADKDIRKINFLTYMNSNGSKQLLEDIDKCSTGEVLEKTLKLLKKYPRPMLSNCGLHGKKELSNYGMNVWLYILQNCPNLTNL